jgi:PAS domain S-box-containing protein
MKVTEQQANDLFAASSGNVAFYVVSKKGIRTVFYTKELVESSLYSEAELKAQFQGSLVNLVFENDRYLYKKAAERLLKGEPSVVSAYRIHRKDGKSNWARAIQTAVGEYQEGLLVKVDYLQVNDDIDTFKATLTMSDTLVMIIDPYTMELLFVSDKTLAEYGKTNADYAGQTCHFFLHGCKEDCSFCRIKNVKLNSSSTEKWKMPSNGKWYQIVSRRTTILGREIYIEFLTDINDLVKAQEEAEKEKNSFQRIVNNIPSGVCVFRKKDGVVSRIAVNSGICQIKGLSEKDIINETNEEITRRTYPDDREAVWKDTQNLFVNDTCSITYRTFNEAKQQYIWLHRDGHHIKGEDGSDLAYVSYTDISDQKKLQHELSEKTSELAALVSAMPGGVIKYNRETKEMAFVSGNVLSMLGYTYQEFIEKFHNSFPLLIYVEDREKALASIDEQLKKSSFDNVQFRIEKKNGKLKWFYYAEHLVKGADGITWSYVVLVDLTKQKQLEEAYDQKEKDLEGSRARLQTAVRGASIATWEYDVQNHTLYSSDKELSRYGLPNIVKGIPGSLHYLLDEDSCKKADKLFEDINEGKSDNYTTEFAFKISVFGKPHFEKHTYTIVEREDGKPIKAYGVSQDITNDRLAENSYQQSVNHVISANPDAQWCYRLNITDNTIEEIYAEPFERRFFAKAKNTDDFFRIQIKSAYSQSQQQSLANVFTRKHLMEAFAGGNIQFSVDYSLLKKNEVCWNQVFFYLTQNPKTGSLEAITYAIDNTESHKKLDILNNLSQDNFDFTVLIDTIGRSFELETIGVNDKIVPEKRHYENYEADMPKLIKTCLGEVQDENLMKSLAIDNLEKELENQQRFSFSCSVLSSDGKAKRKTLRFAFIDENRRFILMSVLDVTESFLKEQDAMNKLNSAYEEAKKANQAKTVFLSNISHDMRTPLNGVIGYTDIALESHDPEVLRDYLKKISDSGNMLLQLINDTLDLSKIETGKFTLHPAPVSCGEVLKSIVTTVKPNIDAKHQHFIIDNEKAVMADIFVDRARVEEIFINLLSNAIKFTPEGGTIVFGVECEKLEVGTVHDKLTVSDNGCGISKEFIEKHLYEPFMQERTSVNQYVSGTGLGLSIVKRLVNLMGGTIEVSSELGKGTTFVVHLAFKRIDDYHKDQKAEEDSLNLSGKHILLVEDNPINLDIAKTLLEMKKIIVDTAADGSEAVQKFEASTPDFYDAILMDIRMPKMNGIEAAKAIRKFERPDSAKVPIIAMTANAYEEDKEETKKAGMNDHLSKPIDSHAMYMSIARLTALKK